MAYMSLLENEMRRFQFQQGTARDSSTTPSRSKRSRCRPCFSPPQIHPRVAALAGDVDVNLFARKYFSGGGHKNAAGGKSFVSMQETIDHYVRSVREFADEGHLG